MMLTVEAYDAAERAARDVACYPAIRAFTPTCFQHIGLPTRATCEAELDRYVDMMGKTNVRESWWGSGEAQFSEREAADLMLLRVHIERLTERLFGHAITPIANAVSPWPILRVVRHIAKKLGRRLDIFEAGAGPGCLGAYLIQDGHEYTGLDVTQGLYLWQNRLWSSLTSDFAEHVDPEADLARVNHLPWWQFALYHEAPGRYDVVICDSALGEMTDFGYPYFVYAARQMVEGGGCLLLTHVGEPWYRANAVVFGGDLATLGLRHRASYGVNVFYHPDFNVGMLDVQDWPVRT